MMRSVFFYTLLVVSPSAFADLAGVWSSTDFAYSRMYLSEEGYKHYPRTECQPVTMKITLSENFITIDEFKYNCPDLPQRVFSRTKFEIGANGTILHDGFEVGLLSKTRLQANYLSGWFHDTWLAISIGRGGSLIVAITQNLFLGNDWSYFRKIQATFSRGE